MRHGFPPVIVEMRPSHIDPGGVGVFALVSIRKGARVFEGVHVDDFKHVVPWATFKTLPRLVRKKVLAFCVGTEKGFIPPNDGNFNDLSIDWFLNHSCDGNIGFDLNGDFVAKRNIRAGEELAYDYALIESNPSFLMQCSCGSESCRRKITGEDWKELKKDPSKLQWMHPYLRKHR